MDISEAAAKRSQKDVEDFRVALAKLRKVYFGLNTIDLTFGDFLSYIKVENTTNKPKPKTHADLTDSLAERSAQDIERENLKLQEEQRAKAKNWTAEQKAQFEMSLGRYGIGKKPGEQITGEKIVPHFGGK